MILKLIKQDEIIPLPEHKCDKIYLKLIETLQQTSFYNYLHMILYDYYRLHNDKNFKLINPLKFLLNGTFSFDPILNINPLHVLQSFTHNAIDHNEICNICMTNPRNIQLTC